MASYHFSIKSKKKGNALNHANYIAREQRHKLSEEDTDLVLSGFGNMPSWVNGDPSTYWRAADKYERANGAACKEWVIALPRELTIEQQHALVQELISTSLQGRPYQYAIHNPRGSLDGFDQPHAHIIFSDRQPDSIERPAEHYFLRYNAKNPAAGGCKKNSGGKSPLALKTEVISLRSTWADIQNRALIAHGYPGRVDHRSLEAQGIERAPETHLGPVRIKKMSTEARAAHREMRKNSKLSVFDLLQMKF